MIPLTINTAKKNTQHSVSLTVPDFVPGSAAVPTISFVNAPDQSAVGVVVSECLKGGVPIVGAKTFAPVVNVANALTEADANNHQIVKLAEVFLRRESEKEEEGLEVFPIIAHAMVYVLDNADQINQALVNKPQTTFKDLTDKTTRSLIVGNER